MRHVGIRLLLVVLVAGVPWIGRSVLADHAPAGCRTRIEISGEETACENDAVLMADVTLPGGSCAKPRQPMEKVWLLRNEGTCEWRTGYTLEWVGASRMDSPGAVPVAGVLPGAVVTVTVPITAFVYAQPTVAESVWQMHSPAGEPFGERLMVRYTVRSNCQQPNVAP